MAVRKFLMPALESARPELEAILRERVEELAAGQQETTGTLAGRFDRGGVEIYLSVDASALVEALERVRDGALEAWEFMPDSSRSPATPDDGDLDEPDSWCRVMPTRRCPAVYGGVCGDRPCARYESDSEEPWLPVDRG